MDKETIEGKYGVDNGKDDNILPNPPAPVILKSYQNPAGEWFYRLKIGSIIQDVKSSRLLSIRDAEQMAADIAPRIIDAKINMAVAQVPAGLLDKETAYQLYLSGELIFRGRDNGDNEIQI